MTISEEIQHVIEPENIFAFKIAGIEIGVRDSVIAMWIFTIILIVVVRLLVKKLQTIPNKKQSVIESFVEMINNFVKNNGAEHHFKEVAPFIGTLILFLGFMNIGSIFNIIPDPHELYEIFRWEFLLKLPVIKLFPPTKDINITLGLAIVTMGMVFYKTLKIKKIKGGLHTFIEPVPLMLPFKLLDFIVRPMSLTLRMFINVMAAFIMMELVYLVIPMILPGVLSLYFDIFDGLLQAFIFAFLTTLYMAEALEQK